MQILGILFNKAQKPQIINVSAATAKIGLYIEAGWTDCVNFHVGEFASPSTIFSDPSSKRPLPSLSCVE
jgi:hypothetical protein